MSRSIKFKLVLTGFLLLIAFVPSFAQAKGPAPAEIFASISVAELPTPGAQTYALIHQGGPFAHEKDGSLFGNRERLLPAEKRGYYREYTVAKPNSRDRGVRRIVCGGQARMPDTCYYTGDHYASFRRIIP